jgi:hypothetical protein
MIGCGADGKVLGESVQGSLIVMVSGARRIADE